MQIHCRNFKDISKYIAFSYPPYLYCIMFTFIIFMYFYFILHHTSSDTDDYPCFSQYCILGNILIIKGEGSEDALYRHDITLIFIFLYTFDINSLSILVDICIRKISQRCMYLIQFALFRILLTNHLFLVLSSCLYNGCGKRKGTLLYLTARSSRSSET